MKILITNFSLGNRAGSEMFTVQLAIELKKRGHKVFVFSPTLGAVAEEIKKENIPIADDVAAFENEKFDVIHAQHNITAILARSIFPDVPMVFMIHGTVPAVEQPPSIDLGIIKYLVVSEKVVEHINEKYGVPMEKIEIVRNFIDFEKFYPKNNVNEKPKNLLVISNHYSDKVRNVIERSCDELKIKHFHVGMPNNPVKNVEDYINKADVVVTLGRGALEAMACERNVIIFDIHGGDGMVKENNFYELRKHSFSGKIIGQMYTKDQFIEELKKYDPENGKKLRKIVEKENGKDFIVKNLEKIYLNTANERKFSSCMEKGQLYPEFSFLLKDKKREIDLMKSSKFWDLREKYMKLRKLI